MKISSLTCLAMVLALVLNGCESKPAHDSVMKESIGTMKELVTILKGVTDEASANSAKPKLEALSKQMKELQAKQSKLPTPTAEEQKALTAKYEPEMKALFPDLISNAMRIQMDPKLGAILKDSMPNDSSAPPMLGGN